MQNEAQVVIEDQYTKNINDLFKIVDEQDPTAALEELQHRMDTDPYVFKNCHAMAHEIGHAGYKKYNDFVKAMSYQLPTCSDGYLHGVIEARFAAVTDIYGEMKKVCLPYKALAGRCYHGVGHGIMYYTANDLPKALTICESYKGMSRGRCYEGVFMENFISGTKAHPSTYLDPKNPMYPCPSERSVYKDYCYFYAPYYFLRLSDNDYAAAIKWCATAEKGYANACVRGVGSIAMKFNIKDPKAVEKICDTAATGSAKAACIDGMVSYYMTFYADFGKLREMCTTLEKQNQAACYVGVKNQGGKVTSHINI